MKTFREFILECELVEGIQPTTSKRKNVEKDI